MLVVLVFSPVAVLVCSPGRSVHSCRLPAHIFHLMFNSCSQNKQLMTKNHRRGKYVVFNRRNTETELVSSEQIHIVSSHTGNWAIVRRFHFTASFRIIIHRTINTIPTSSLPLSHGRKLNCKGENNCESMFRDFSSRL